jgi:tetratricopeptide (TPR) repeat protein
MKSLVVYYKAKCTIGHDDGVRLSGLIGQMAAAPGMLRLLNQEKKGEEASRLYRIMRQVSRAGPEPRRDDLMVSVGIILFNIAPSERLIYHLSRIKPSDASDHLQYQYHAILALNFLLMGHLDLASVHATGTLRHAGGRDRSAYTRILQGCIAIRQGDHDSAISFLSEGSKCWNGRIRAMASFYKGSVYFEKGDFRQAIRCFESAGGHAGDAASQATVHSHIGACAVNLGDLDRAQREFEAMGRLTEKLKSEHKRRYGLIADSYMGIVSRARGQYDVAMCYYKRAMQACIMADDKEGIANLLGNMGLLHQYSGDHARAMQLFNVCLLYSERMGYWTGIEFSLRHMYRSLVSRGRKSEAAKLRHMYVAKYPELHAIF